MAGVMLFSLTACGKKVKEYDVDSATKLMVDKLKIDEDDIYASDFDDYKGDMKGEGVTAKYEDARIMIMVFDDEDDAKDVFDEAYDQFDDTFDKNDTFKGDYVYAFEKDYGYIVIKGEAPGTDLFGDRFRTGSVYAGIYYSGSMVAYVMPEGMDVSEDDIGKVIETFKFPDV